MRRVLRRARRRVAATRPVTVADSDLLSRSASLASCPSRCMQYTQLHNRPLLRWYVARSGACLLPTRLSGDDRRRVRPQARGADYVSRARHTIRWNSDASPTKKCSTGTRLGFAAGYSMHVFFLSVRAP